MGQLYFDEESIYEISKPCLEFWTDTQMDGRTDEQAQSNMPIQLFQKFGAYLTRKVSKTIGYHSYNHYLMLFFEHYQAKPI